MARLGTTGWLQKWIATVGVLLILAAWLYSSRRAVSWRSPSLRHEFSLMHATVNYVRYSDDWLRNPSVSLISGWSVDVYYDEFWGMYWMFVYFPSDYETRFANSVAMPLWFPLAPIAAVAAILWYRDRTCFRTAARRWADRLRPKRRKKVTVWVIAAFTLAHVVLGVFALMIEIALYGFLFPFTFGQVHWTGHLSEWWVRCAIWAAPLWAILWAWLFVRLRNRLLVAQAGSRCLECGYDLTGNVSGRCSECGAAVPVGEAVRGR